MGTIAGLFEATRLPGADRYEVQTRLWSSPGSARLSQEAGALSETWKALLFSYDNSDEWEQARSAHITAIRTYEGAIRRVMGDTAPLPD
jgi:hypothetical protein